MKKRFLVTVSYEREVNSDWYEDTDSDKLELNFQNELQSDVGLDVIVHDIENYEVTISTKEIS